MKPQPGVEAVVALGANLGEPLAQLRAAAQALAQLPHTELLRASRVYASRALGPGGQELEASPDYLNAAVLLRTQLCAPELLAALQAIEAAHGRQRPHANAPRTLDLDLIFYGQARIQSPLLTVPHPRWHERAFVLLPLQDLGDTRATAPQVAACAAQRIEATACALVSGM